MNGMKLEHLQELEEAMDLHLDIVFYLDGTIFPGEITDRLSAPVRTVTLSSMKTRKRLSEANR